MTLTLASMIATARSAVREIPPAEALQALNSGAVGLIGPGARSLLAAQTLASMGYERVEVLGRGLVAWDAAGLPGKREHEAATT